MNTETNSLSKDRKINSNQAYSLVCLLTGPSLPMATVDIKNPEINTNRFYGSQVNNMSYTKEKKKGKAKKKKLTKADIGTPSNFQ